MARMAAPQAAHPYPWVVPHPVPFQFLNVQEEKETQKQEHQTAAAEETHRRERESWERKMADQREELAHERLQLDEYRARLNKVQLAYDQMCIEKTGLQQSVVDAVQKREKAMHELHTKEHEVQKISSSKVAEAKEMQEQLKSQAHEMRSLQDHNIQMQEKLKVSHSQVEAFRQEMLRLERLLQNMVEDQEKTKLEKEEKKEVQEHYQSVNLVAGNGAKRLRSMVNKYMAMFYRDRYREKLAEGLRWEEHRIEVDRELRSWKEKYEYDREQSKKSIDRTTMVLNEDLQARASTIVYLKENQQQLEEELGKLERRAMLDKVDIVAREKQIQELEEKLAYVPDTSQAIFLKNFGNFMIDSFEGDYLDLCNNVKLLSTIYQNGDLGEEIAQKPVAFSDYVKKINRNNREQKRILVMTQKSLYNALPNRNVTVKRRIPINQIQSVTMSRKASDLFVIHCSEDNDFLYRSSKRSEIIYHLMNLFKTLTGNELGFAYSENLYVGDMDAMMRQVVVTDSQTVKFGPSSLVLPAAE